MEEQETSMENGTHASKGPTTQSLKLLQSQWHIITTFNLKGEKKFHCMNKAERNYYSTTFATQSYL